MKDFLNTVGAFFTPKKFYSWQTAIGLCVFAWLFALITIDFSQFILIQLGWIFLIIGVGWMTSENPVQAWGLSLSPWITGILVCIFLFVTDLESGVPRLAFIFWPIASSLIAIFPSTFNPETGFYLPKVSDRPRLLILLLSNVLILCWILFYFQVQDWINAYPELKQESFKKSAFVIAIGRPNDTESRGIQVASLMGEEVILQNNGKTRSEVEKWLFDLQNQPNAPTEFRSAVLGRLNTLDKRQSADQSFWQLEISISDPEYQLTLGARWLGPASRPGEEVIQQVCQISFSGEQPQDVARVECKAAQRIQPKG